MVSSKNGDSFSESDFEGHEQRHCFYRVITSVDVITHEQVICIWRFASDFKELHKIMELSVNISANCDRTFDWLHIAFLRQDFLGLKLVKLIFITYFFTKSFDFMLRYRLVIK